RASAAQNARFGQPPTKAVQRSVPPLIEESQTSRLTPYTRRHPSLERGEPVEPTPLSCLSLCVSPGRSPAFIQELMYAALVPKKVIPDESASLQRASKSGEPGLPS